MESWVIYLSTATKLFSLEAVFAIVEQSRKNNQAAASRAFCFTSTEAFFRCWRPTRDGQPLCTLSFGRIRGMLT
jgi:hypothetical protein